jgi:hypothetical protein
MSIMALIAMAAILLSDVDVARAQCTWYDELMHVEGHGALDGEARDVAFAAGFAYVAAADAGLHVVNVSDPAQPLLVATVDTPGQARGVAVSSDLVFVADLLEGLLVVDASDPAAPEIAGSLPLAGRALGVVVEGDHAYVAARESGMHIVDVSQPAQPALVATVDTPGEASFVALSGDHACVADSSQGLQIIDVSDVAQPEIIGSVDTPGSALGVAVWGSLAYVADGLDGLHVVSIETPTAPHIVSTRATLGSAVGVAIAGRHALVADYYWPGLLSFDLSDPVAPLFAGGVRTLRAWRVATAGDVAYVASAESGLDVVDISSPFGAPPVGQADVPWASEVTVRGPHAYVLGDHGLYAVDVADPAAPVLGGLGATTAIARDLALTATHAFVVGSDFEGCLSVFDIQSPMQPALVSEQWLPDSPSGIAVTGDHALFTDRHGLRVVRIDDPTQPEVVTLLDLVGRPWDVAVDGDHAYVAADDGGGFQVVDISDVENPVHVAGLPLDCGSITIVGSLAYLTPGPRIVDISDPLAPYLVASIDVAAPTMSVAASGSYAYVATLWHGVHVFDVSTPASPAFVTVFRTIDRASDVFLADDVLYVADTQGGLLTLWPQCEQTTAVAPGTAAGLSRGLLRANPNPFASSTRIAYELPGDASVSLRIYDVSGRLLRVLDSDAPRTRGEHAVWWDGRDARDRPVPSGIYFVRLDAPGTDRTERVLRIR